MPKLNLPSGTKGRARRDGDHAKGGEARRQGNVGTGTMNLFSSLFSRKKKENIVGTERAPVNQAVARDEKPTSALPKGEDAGAYQTIIGPHVTEKASLLGSLNKYVFRVSPNSTKIDIKRAIEKLYRVKVKKVGIVSIPPKERRLGKQIGYRSGFKKAMVTLVEGNKIDVVT